MFQLYIKQVQKFTRYCEIHGRNMSHNVGPMTYYYQQRDQFTWMRKRETIYLSCISWALSYNLSPWLLKRKMRSNNDNNENNVLYKWWDHSPRSDFSTNALSYLSWATISLSRSLDSSISSKNSTNEYSRTLNMRWHCRFVSIFSLVKIKAKQENMKPMEALKR